MQILGWIYTATCVLIYRQSIFLSGAPISNSRPHLGWPGVGRKAWALLATEESLPRKVKPTRQSTKILKNTWTYSCMQRYMYMDTQSLLHYTWVRPVTASGIVMLAASWLVITQGVFSGQMHREEYISWLYTSSLYVIHTILHTWRICAYSVNVCISK